MPFKVIIFDMGGVLIDVDPERKNKFTSKCARKEKINEFRASKAILDFDAGKITSVRFYYIVKDVLGYAGNFLDFTDDYNSILFPKNEMFDFLTLLRRKNPHLNFWLLSNVSGLHWKYISETWPDVISQFSKLFLSFEIGCIKPHREIYEAVYDEGNEKPENTIFVDDRFENGAYPFRMGAKFIHFETRARLAEELAFLGIAV